MSHERVIGISHDVNCTKILVTCEAQLGKQVCSSMFQSVVVRLVDRHIGADVMVQVHVLH